VVVGLEIVVDVDRVVCDVSEELLVEVIDTVVDVEEFVGKDEVVKAHPETAATMKIETINPMSFLMVSLL
jgi:hypothetical protein